MRERINKILENPFFRNIFKLSASSVFMMGLSIVSTPILSRIFTPEAYGEWGVFSSVAMILSSFIFFSYENAIIKTTDKRELPAILWLCILSAIFVTLLTLVVFFIGSLLHIAFFIKYPSIIMLVVFLIATAFDVLSYNIANRYAKYNVMSMSNLVMGVIQPTTRILFGLIPLSKGLIYGNIISLLFKFSYVIANIKEILKTEFIHKVSLYDIKQAAVKYKKFPVYDAPARMIEYFIGNIVIIILSIFFKLEEIGCFSMIAQLVLAPITLIGTSMSTVYFKDLADAVKENNQISEVTKRTVRVCFLMAILSSFFFALGGDRLIVLFLGHKWILAGDMSLCLTIYSLPVILSEPLLPIFKVLDKQNMRFWLNMANLVLSVGALLLGAYVIHNILIVLILYSFSYALLRFIMFRNQLRLANVSLLSFKKELLGVLLIYVCLAARLFFVLN